MHENELKIRSKLALLENGLYIVRYASRAAGEGVSCVTLNTSPIGRGTIDFFPAEGVTRNTMTKPGDCVVLRVKGEKTGLLITEFATSSQAAPIEIRIDHIGSAEPKSPSSVLQEQPTSRQATLPTQSKKISCVLSGHIEGIGDTTAVNGWLGVPSSLKRIEGFSVDVSGLPDGLILAYSSRSGKNAEPQIGTAGRFVGTRRQAKPITAVAFALSGERASSFELVGHVVFAATPPLPLVSGKELSGATGTEQLVAMQLEIRPKAPSQSPNQGSPWEDNSRMHIFKE